MAAEVSSHKIVIVEDEGLIAADLEARLKQAGYSVPGTADTASKALQLVGQASPDLVLMDIRLKGSVDGIETADQIRKLHDIPVLFLTAYEDAGTLERAGRSQAFGYLRKPIATAGLKGAIEIAIAKHRFERDLREQRDWAIASFSSLPDAVFVTDRQGRITYLNAPAEELIDAVSDQAMGKDCWEVLHLRYRESGEKVHDLIPSAILAGETLMLPKGICQERRGQLTGAIRGTVAPRSIKSKIEGTIITLSDATNSWFDEEQARQDSKHEALQRMADGITRELRQMTETEDGTEPFDRIASRLTTLLLAPEVSIASVDIGALLRKLETAWTKVEPELRVTLELNDAIVQADSGQLTGALVAILLHARSQMKTKGVLSVGVTPSHIPQMLHAVRIRISYPTKVDAKAFDRVFEPTWSEGSRDLSAVYGLLTRMGVVVSAHLEGGDSAVIDLYFPRAEMQASGAPLPEVVLQ